MVNLTREDLIKTIVSREIIEIGQIEFATAKEYTCKLKELYNKWESASIEEICKRYNILESTNITVDNLANS